MKRGAVVAGSVSLSWGLVAAVASYAIVRTIQFFLYPDPNPRALVWSAHAGYFWRVWTVSYAGGMVAFAVLLVARESVEVPARALVPAIGVAGGLLALQAALFP